MTLFEMAGAAATRVSALRDTPHRANQANRLHSSLERRAAEDPLSRDVYGIMGVPIDVTSLPEVVARLKQAAEAKVPFVLSTPNLNFLVLSQGDASFRESLLMSDLCPADGMAIVWLGRLLGIPLEGRIAGSDIFDAIKQDHTSIKPMNVFFFGGAEGLAQSVAAKINASSAGMKCVGAICPGFGTVEQISGPQFFEEINASGADFVAAFLGAKKGQEWLVRNHYRIGIPIRAHLGATINYQAGTVQRAPLFLQACGLEWLWRIKEEPYLWQRYLRDGAALMRILVTSVLPNLAREFVRSRFGGKGMELEVYTREDQDGWIHLFISGEATKQFIEKATSNFREAIGRGGNILVDLSQATAVDERILGLLIMARKVVKQNGLRFRVICRNDKLNRSIRLRGFGYLLDEAN